jgi:hypothetical protein
MRQQLVCVNHFANPLFVLARTHGPCYSCRPTCVPGPHVMDGRQEPRVMYPKGDPVVHDFYISHRLPCPALVQCTVQGTEKRGEKKEEGSQPPADLAALWRRPPALHKVTPPPPPGASQPHSQSQHTVISHRLSTHNRRGARVSTAQHTAGEGEAMGEVSEDDGGAPCGSTPASPKGGAF